MSPTSCGLRASGSVSVFVDSLLFLPEILDDQKTVDRESPELKK
jgi:hypothetical protein